MGPPASRPTVSVCTATYNHERFIGACVQSVLDQKADFQIEQVIGEDCSTDGTRQVLQGLAARHPDRIRLLLQPRNVGAFQNFNAAFAACRGRYIALLDGDDYWTSPEKLATQVAFLEAHPEYAMVFHRVRSVRDDTGVTLGVNPPEHPPTSTLDDLLRGNFIGTPSVMYRAGLVREFPAWAAAQLSSDWMMHALHAQHGNIGFLDAAMAVYRVHAGGAWTSLLPEKRWLSELEMLRQLDAHLGFAHHAPIAAAIAMRHFLLAHARLDANDVPAAARHAFEAVRVRPRRPLSIAKLSARFIPGPRRWLRSPAQVYIVPDTT